MPVLKPLVFLVAIAVAALIFVLLRRRGSGGSKLTDKRARAEVMKQLLALSEEAPSPSAATTPVKNTPKPPVPEPRPLPAMTRQQRRAEERKAKKLAFAKSQRA
jgi:hypothetical protein